MSSSDIVFSTCLNSSPAKLAFDCHVSAIVLNGALMTTYSGEFEEHIRDLLSNLYDYLKLVENPVAQRLAQGHSGKERMHIVHGVMRSAIDGLQRETGASPTSRQNRLYNILLLRYVEEQGTNDVLNLLALSERQYYREHQRAIQTVSQVIWDEHFAGADEAATLSLADELDYLSIDKGHASFDAGAEVAAATRAMRVIAERRGIEVFLDQANELIRLSVSQPVFRQLVILLLTELMGAMRAGGRIKIKLSANDGEPTIGFFGVENMAISCQQLQNDETARALLKSLNARLDCATAPDQLTLTFRQLAHKILIVDDNPDTVGLFKRYLANLPFELLAAQEEGEALRIAQGTPLLCIILDVMLPGKDGWQILQSCKNHPATADIPVLICSVLEMEELALSLGADGYLKKPPTRDEFLATLSNWMV